MEKTAGETLQDRARLCQELLTRLSGVYAAKLQTTPEGDISEIHILAGSSRGAKQLVRDARSALFAAYGLDVDHRKFSVAQIQEALGDELSEQPAAPEIRLRGGELEQTQTAESFSVKVTLRQGEKLYMGASSARNVESRRLRAVAEAVLQAIHEYLGREQVFTLLSVQRIVSTPVPVIVVILEYLDGDRELLLVGAAQDGENSCLGVERATLDAVNRKLSQIS